MMSAKLSNETRKKIYRRDGFRCALCDSTRGLQIHHAIARSAGGSNNPMNLICLCWKCHAVAHGTQMPDYPDHINQPWMEQAITEYLSDLYAEEGLVWNPWEGKFHR